MKNSKILASVASVSIAGGLPLTAHAQITYQTLQYPGTDDHRPHRLPRRQHHRQLQFSSRPGGLLYRTVTGAVPGLSRGDGQRRQLSRRPVEPALQPDLRFARRHPARSRHLQADRPASIRATSGTMPPRPDSSPTLINVPGALNTIVHSQFGNQVVGNFNTNSASAASSTTTSRPAASPPSRCRGRPAPSAYGIWGDRIAGGYSSRRRRPRLPLQPDDRRLHDLRRAGHGRRSTRISKASRRAAAPANSTSPPSRPTAPACTAWAVKIDVNGVATWTEI